MLCVHCRNYSLQLEDVYVERRVQQRLGTWTPPPLTPSEKSRLIAERDVIIAEIRDIEQRKKSTKFA
jgi:hypothetical protein